MVKENKKKRALFCGIAIILTILTTAHVFASAEYPMTYYSGTDDIVTNLPDSDYGVNGEVYTVSPQVPVREGYRFLGWVLDYEIRYSVTYVVNSDPAFGVPEDFLLPTDSKKYMPGEMVDVADQLTTKVDYAFNDKGEKVKGTWEFTAWDKDDFPIHEDITVTGGWKFTPAPTKVYNYTVEYWLVDGIKLVAKVADDKPDGTVDALGDKVVEEAIPMGSTKLYARYRSSKKYRIKPGWEKVTATITKDNQVIYIFYEVIPHGA